MMRRGRYAKWLAWPIQPLRAGARRAEARLEHFDTSAAVSIRSAEELARLTPGLARPLCQELGVQALAARMLPVLLDDGSAAVFALREHVGSDQAAELIRLVRSAGYRIADTSRYVVTAALLVAVGRGLHARDAQSGAMGPAASHTALAAAFHDLVAWGVRCGASDIHINIHLREPVSEVRYTIATRYVAPDCFKGMSTAMLMDMLAVGWMDVRGGNGAVFDPLKEQQGSLYVMVDGHMCSLRWSSMAADAGPSVCLRILDKPFDAGGPGLQQLGYLPEQMEQIERAMLSQGGAVVVAGMVGSGKSTSLAALIRGVASHRKVISLEDPVEYRIPGAIQNSIVRNLDADSHTAYATKLRALKRSAMSDVLLGEVRDRETGRAFMDLSISGVNVYTTVHAPSAALIPARLSSAFIGVPHDFLATPGVIKLLAWQALLPALCPGCSQPVECLLASGGLHPCGAWRTALQWGQWLDRVQQMHGGGKGRMRIRNEAGCDACIGVGAHELHGYAGQALVAELVEPAMGARPARSAMEHAVRLAYEGRLDPRDIEMRFQAFETCWLSRGADAWEKDAARSGGAS
jgi:type II secretory ATPase GspE/PulE/Tfp pilus assembly ATPase PilB-like protein